MIGYVAGMSVVLVGLFLLYLLVVLGADYAVVHS